MTRWRWSPGTLYLMEAPSAWTWLMIVWDPQIYLRSSSPSTTVAVNDDVKLRQLSVDEVRLWQSAGMRLRRWPVGPRASIRYTSA